MKWIATICQAKHFCFNPQTTMNVSLAMEDVSTHVPTSSLATTVAVTKDSLWTAMDSLAMVIVCPFLGRYTVLVHAPSVVPPAVSNFLKSVVTKCTIQEESTAFVLSSFVACLYLMLDIDECSLKTDNCSEVCNNIEGGFTCGCYSHGFEVVVSDQPCMGKLFVVLHADYLQVQYSPR